MDKRKPKNLDACIRRLLGEGYLVPIYFAQGINSLKAQINSMTDDELYVKFDGLFAPRQIRGDVDYLFTTINNFIKEYER